MKVSFCITAYNEDIKYLDKCLSFINKQTILPDEIILLVSNINKWNGPISVNTIIYNTLLSAGQARNKLIDISLSDILCFCDIDDEIHPQKCEIVKKIFLENNINALVHDYNINSSVFENLNVDTSTTVYKINGVDPNPASTNLTPPVDGNITHGHISVKKQILIDSNIRYINSSFGEDGKFCRDIFNFDQNKMFYSPLKLINYIL